jgi:hypothetical protein
MEIEIRHAPMLYTTLKPVLLSLQTRNNLSNVELEGVHNVG